MLLFVLPMITMRTYAEEKRSGTIELLLTSPLTDLQIILGKFLGAMALYAAMLGVTLVHIGVLFVYGNPEWKPIATAYLGLLLHGRLLHLGRAVHLEPHEEPDRRRHADLRASSCCCGSSTGSAAFARADRRDAIVSYLSITEHFDDFAKGVIDTTHVIYYLSFITFGLFLTAKSVDSERWRG